MILHLVIEFGPYNWHPHYKNIKKILRNNRVPFIAKKRAIEQGILHSIWADEKHIEKARELVSSYEIKDSFSVAEEERVEKISKEFEANWFWYITVLFIRYPITNPWIFLILFILVITIVVVPLVQYGFIG